MSKFYVYELVDRRDGLPFYVGKGCGARARVHLSDASRGKDGARLQRIRDIQGAGAEVEIRIIEDGLCEDEALAMEAQRIAEIGIGSLTNRCVRGARSASETNAMRGALGRLVEHVFSMIPAEPGDPRLPICQGHHETMMRLFVLFEKLMTPEDIRAVERSRRVGPPAAPFQPAPSVV